LGGSDALTSVTRKAHPLEPIYETAEVEIALFLIQLCLIADPGRLISARLVVNPDFKPFQLFPFLLLDNFLVAAWSSVLYLPTRRTSVPYHERTTRSHVL